MRNFDVQKKPRGIPRRIRFLQRWSSSFRGFYPRDLAPSESYWNFKIPVIRSMVEGRHSTMDLKKICAQALIDAAHYVWLAKPDDAPSEARVTCCICLPEMFASELCIYNKQDYFCEHTSEGEGRFGKIEKISSKSIAFEWGLVLPTGFKELGVSCLYEGDDGKMYVSEHWYFGEVG